MSTTNSIKEVVTYVNFDGRCEEAIEFYRKAVGAQVEVIMRFKDNPEPLPPGQVPPGTENKIMHASMRIGNTTLMASDGRCTGKGAAFAGFMLAVRVPTEADADRVFGALADGGQVQMPLAKTFFSPRFGMLADRFGVTWMVLVQH